MLTRTSVFYAYSEMSANRLLGSDTCEDAVSISFMSAENIDLLNHAIIQGVFDDTQGRLRIGTQSQSELLAIMCSVHASEARHLPSAIHEQVAALNASVLNYCVPHIVSEAQMHHFYMRDRNQGTREPVQRSIMTSTTGSRSEVVAPSRAYFAPNQA